MTGQSATYGITATATSPATSAAALTSEMIAVASRLNSAVLWCQTINPFTNLCGSGNLVPGLYCEALPAASVFSSTVPLGWKGFDVQKVGCETCPGIIPPGGRASTSMMLGRMQHR